MSLNYKIHPNSYGSEVSMSAYKSVGKQLDQKTLFVAIRPLSITNYNRLLDTQNINSETNNKLEIDLAVLKFIMIAIMIDITFYSCFWLLK